LTIAIDLKYRNRKPETYEIPVGPLPPCRQVGITDAGNLEKEGLTEGLQDFVTYAYFVDPAGRKWKRYVGQEPKEVATIPKVDVTAQGTAPIVRTDIQRIDPCG